MRILLVEEDQRLATVIGRGLMADRYAIDIVGDGREGLQYFETYSYDLILLDPGVPKLAGNLLLERIRSKNSNIPVLVLSCSKSIDDKIRLFNIGADDHLIKPIVFAELRARIQALLRRRPPLSSDTVRGAGVELDRLKHQVRCKDKAVDLTSREFLLLDYLMRYPKSVHSPDLIAQKAWSSQENSNTVRVCIHHLRRKLGVHHSNGPIKTVPGAGYTFSGRETYGALESCVE